MEVSSSTHVSSRPKLRSSASQFQITYASIGDVQNTADAIHLALTLSDEQRKSNHQKLFNVSYNSYFSLCRYRYLLFLLPLRCYGLKADTQQSMSANTQPKLGVFLSSMNVCDFF